MSYSYQAQSRSHEQGLWLKFVAEWECFKQKYKRQLDNHDNYLNEITDNIIADIDIFKKNLTVVCAASQTQLSFWKTGSGAVKTIRGKLNENPLVLINTIHTVISSEDVVPLKKALVKMILSNFCNKIEKYQENRKELAKERAYYVDDSHVLSSILIKLIIKLKKYAVIELTTLPTVNESKQPSK